MLFLLLLTTFSGICSDKQLPIVDIVIALYNPCKGHTCLADEICVGVETPAGVLVAQCEKCPSGTVYSACSSCSQLKTCFGLTSPQPCPRPCEPACVCRNSSELVNPCGTCVPPKLCPKPGGFLHCPKIPAT